MGLDDRDYMRERYRQRQGLTGRETRWNDKAGRVEGTWFGAKNRGFDYQKGRYRPATRFRAHPAQSLVFVLSAALALIPAYREAKRFGWLPDFGETLPFPSSGSVTVASGVDPKTATSKLRVATDKANAVIQLHDALTARHVISVYVGRNDDVTVPVPPGTYKVSLVEGDKWHGPERYFGWSTTYDTVVKDLTFENRTIHGIDLHRRPDGNLPTRFNLGDPEPL